jgi:hypothetical protein
MNRLLIITVALFAAFIAWQVSVTRARRAAATPAPVATETVAAPSVPPGGEEGCRVHAREALTVWGSNRAQITLSPPPYDVTGWSAVRGSIDEKIDAADKACECETEPCMRIRTAMLDLRHLVVDFDASIRNGSMPADFASRQQAIGAKVSGSEYPAEKTPGH